MILSSAIVPAMKFQLNQKLKAAYVLFTTHSRATRSFFFFLTGPDEGKLNHRYDSPTHQLTGVQMSEANATLFTQCDGSDTEAARGCA